MKTLYKFNVDCGRMGDLQGIFIEDSDKVAKLIESGDEVYFGECLGKHSYICFAIEEEMLTAVSVDPNVIAVIEDNDLTSGYNPFDYIEKE